MNSTVRLTAKQKQAAELLKGPALNVLLYGGARSGKTTLLIEKLIIRAIKYEGSRHLIARLHSSHARGTVWHESLVPALQRFSSRDYKIYKQDMYVTFANGSEIWVGGFDDSDRVEKMLGHEYATIYLNEISQIEYDTVLIAMSRLAQKVEGLQNRAYYDCNPPAPTHWAHRLFIEKVDPKTGEPLRRPELYASMLLNPADNADNLPEGYIEDFLETLSERARRRLLLGEWIKPEGAIYERFSESLVVDELPRDDVERYTVGVDFGLNMAAVLIAWVGDTIYVADDFGGYNYTTATLNGEITRRWKHDYMAYCDPAGGERIQEIAGGTKANNSVEPGIDYINTKIENGQFFISRKASGVLGEINDYRRDEKGRVVKENDHYMDAMRYGIFSAAATRRWRPL
jgi:phage terminase large subunit